MKASRCSLAPETLRCPMRPGYRVELDASKLGSGRARAATFHCPNGASASFFHVMSSGAVQGRCLPGQVLSWMDTQRDYIVYYMAAGEAALRRADKGGRHAS